MANAWHALNNSAVDVLGTVSSTTKVVAHGADALAELTAVAAVNARAYRQEAERDATLLATKRAIRRREENAIEDAEFHKKLDARLAADPELKLAYDKAMAEYTKASPEALDNEAPAELKSVASK